MQVQSLIPGNNGDWDKLLVMRQGSLYMIALMVQIFTAMGPSYNFIPPIVNGTAGALDGNVAANRITGIGGTYAPASSIANGSIFYLRWVDIDNSGSDAGVAVDDFSITLNTASTPTLSLSTSSLSGFDYIEGSGPSASQSYDLSGANLTGYPGNITVTGSTNYEVSTNNLTFSGSVNVPFTSATLSTTAVYVRLKTGLTTGTYNGETISNAGGGATNQNVTCNGTVYKPEPTNHTTNFSAAAGTPDYSSINLTWIDATGGAVPDGYLIKTSDISLGSIVNPVDGAAESNSALVKNIPQGTQTASFTGLSASTTYYFKIYPYTNSSTNIEIIKLMELSHQLHVATGSAPAASLLLEENFDFSGLLTNNGWTAHSSGGTNPISTTAGLTYTNYPSSGIGNAALIGNASGEDIIEVSLNKPQMVLRYISLF